MFESRLTLFTVFSFRKGFTMVNMAPKIVGSLMKWSPLNLSGNASWTTRKTNCILRSFSASKERPAYKIRTARATFVMFTFNALAAANRPTTIDDRGTDIRISIYSSVPILNLAFLPHLIPVWYRNSPNNLALLDLHWLDIAPLYNFDYLTQLFNSLRYTHLYTATLAVKTNQLRPSPVL